MITIQHIYISYQKSLNLYLSTKYDIPKNIDSVINNLPKTNQIRLNTLCGYFNTKWQNIDIDKYFACGFEIYSTKFTIRKILDPKVLKLYIEKDKNIKRNNGITREQLDADLKFIKSWTEQRHYNKRIGLEKEYCKMLDDGIRAPIKHYIVNKISKYTLVWLVSQRFLLLAEEDKRLIPLIMDHYWEYTRELSDIGEGSIYMSKKIPKDIDYLDTKTEALSGKKLLKDKTYSDDIVEQYKENLNEGWRPEEDRITSI
jgi:hypothetical protein